MGGRAANKTGKARRFTSEEARAAGAKAGAIAAAKGSAYMASVGRKGGDSSARDREHMREIGRKGGLASAQRKRHDTDPCPPMSLDPLNPVYQVDEQ